MLEIMARRIHLAPASIALLLLLAACPGSARPAATHRPASPASASSFDFHRRLDAGAFNCAEDNAGNFAYDQQTGGAGFEYPRGSGHHVIFAAGLWLGAKVNGAIRVDVAEYSEDFAPGGMPGGVAQTPTLPQFKVYKVARWTGNPLDSAHVEHTPAELAADPELDPVIHHSWSEYVSGAGPSGAPVKTYRLDNVSTPAPGDSVSVPGPDVKGDQMTWCVFNRAAPSPFHNLASSALPVAVEVRRTCYTFASPGALSNTEYVEYEILNRGAQTLTDLVAGTWADIDLGGFTDDLVGTDVPLGMLYGYNATNADAEYGAAPPAVGIMVLQGPVLGTGDTLRTTASFGFQNGGGTQDSTASYNNMLGFNGDGSARLDPTTGLPTKFMYSGDPITNTGWLDPTPSDKRALVSTGPVTLVPGGSTRVVMAIVVAQGGDRLSSISALRTEARYLRYTAPLLSVASDPVVSRLAFAAPRPNPAISGQRLSFTLPEAGMVDLRIFDVSGRLVRTAFDGVGLPAGERSWQWDARDDRGQRLPAGVYLARLSLGRERAVQRLLLLD